MGFNSGFKGLKDKKEIWSRDAIHFWKKVIVLLIESLSRVNIARETLARMLTRPQLQLKNPGTESKLSILNVISDLPREATNTRFASGDLH